MSRLSDGIDITQEPLNWFKTATGHISSFISYIKKEFDINLNQAEEEIIDIALRRGDAKGIKGITTLLESKGLDIKKIQDITQRFVDGKKDAHKRTRSKEVYSQVGERYVRSMTQVVTGIRPKEYQDYFDMARIDTTQYPNLTNHHASLE